MTDILMPALSPTMTEGKLAKWLKKPGDTVKAGDVIAEIETDKATMEVEAVDEGVLTDILIPEGSEGVAVNAVIARLDGPGPGGSGATGPSPQAPKPGAAPPPATPRGAPGVAAPSPSAVLPQATPPSAQAAHSPAVAPELHRRGGQGTRLFASPLARRLAAEKGIDLAQVRGSGPHGRVVKADIDSFVPEEAPAPVAATQPAGEPKPASADAKQAHVPPAPPSGGGLAPDEVANRLGMVFTAKPNSSVRKIIARRMQESTRDAPHFHLTTDCRLDALLDLRKRLNEGARDDEKLSVNDLVIKCAARALVEKPEANCWWTDAATLFFEAVDISVAVATPNGLITPVIRRAHEKGLATIAREMKDLAARARAGKLKPEEYQGGTFSISNLGMYGIRMFDAVINPPQACILAVGAGERRPVVVGEAIEIQTVMSVTLAVDHRAVDGAVGAEWLQVFKRVVEEPLRLML